MKKPFFLSALFIAYLFSFTPAKAEYNADDIAALKNILLTETNNGLLDKVWVGINENKPNPGASDDPAWDLVDWEDDIKELTWKDGSSDKILTEINWNNFDSPIQITGILKISNLKNLTHLFCYNNDLTGLILTDLPKLEEIEAGYNELEAFSLDGFPELINLDLISNKLKSLTLTNLPKLEYLNCSHSSLTVLDINHLSNLNHLDCSDSELTVLDISSLQKMDYLACFRNKLKELSVYTAAPWIELSCGNNNLPFSQLPADNEINANYYKYTPQILTSTIKQGESYTFEQGSHPSGTISVASCSDSNGTAITGYSLNNDIFTPPAGFSGKLVVAVTHNELKYFDDPSKGFDYDYMELHLTVEKTELPPVPPVTTFLVKIPAIEGITTIPAAGSHEVKKGDPFDLTITISDDYDESEITVLVNGSELKPSPTLRSISYVYHIEEIIQAITIEIKGVEKNDPLGIYNPSESVCRVYTQGSQLFIETLKAMYITVSGMDGRLYLQRNIPEGTTRIELSKGVYIITENQQTWKVLIK